MSDISPPTAQSPAATPVAARPAAHERPKVNTAPTVHASPVVTADPTVEAAHVATCPTANPTLHPLLSHLLPLELSTAKEYISGFITNHFKIAFMNNTSSNPRCSGAIIETQDGLHSRDHVQNSFPASTEALLLFLTQVLQ